MENRNEDRDLEKARKDAAKMPAAGGVHFSAPFIKRPVATTLLSIAIILAGIGGLQDASGGEPAAGGVPDHLDWCESSGRGSGDGRLGHRHSAGTAVCEDRRHQRDDLATPGWATARSCCSST